VPEGLSGGISPGVGGGGGEPPGGHGGGEPDGGVPDGGEPVGIGIGLELGALPVLELPELESVPVSSLLFILLLFC